MNISSINRRTIKQQSTSYDDTNRINTQRDFQTSSDGKTYTLRVSGSERVVQCVVRWSNGAFTKGAAGLFHTAILASEQVSYFIEFV